MEFGGHKNSRIRPHSFITEELVFFFKVVAFVLGRLPTFYRTPFLFVNSTRPQLARGKIGAFASHEAFSLQVDFGVPLGHGPRSITEEQQATRSGCAH